MRYWISTAAVTVLFIIYCFALYGCTYRIEPNSTSMEIGKSENGKEKTTRTLKQTWKWSRIRKLISP